MKILSRSITVAFLSAAAWLSADIAPGDAGWPSAYPEWWYNEADPANGVIDATLPALNEDNGAPLALGQLKHIASEARDELDAQLGEFGGAGDEIDTLVDDFITVAPSNLSPANIGQLKAVSSLFFDRFTEIGFTPASEGWPTGMELIDTTGATDTSPLYPWLNDVSAANIAPSNLGQAKHLFSWDISNFTPPFVDLDTDGMHDLWESVHALDGSEDLDPASDSDYDGYTALIEYQLSTDPNQMSGSVSGVVVVNRWDGVDGNNVDVLNSWPSFPSSPDVQYLVDSLNLPDSDGDHYGVAVYGLMTPPLTGDYVFEIMGDDTADFWLSTSANSDDLELIAYFDDQTYFVWDNQSSQSSVSIPLVAGQAYFFKFHFKEGIGDDYFSARWTRPDNVTEIIPSNVLASVAPNDLDRDGSRDDLEQFIIDADPDDAINSLADVLASDDFDGDTLSNAAEWAAGTNATLKDSDGDSMEDDFELSREDYNPMDPADGASDYDEDGYIATIEAQLGTDPDVFDGSIAGFAFSEAWHNVSGSSIASLKSDSDYPDNPNVQEFVTILQRPQNIREDYGVRVMGYITPPSTGDYYFQVSSDDAGQFWLSTDENPGNIVLRSWVDGAASYENWTQFASQTSVTLSLEVGKYYYFELYLMQNNGADHLSLRWNKPDGSFEILQSANLATFSAYDSDRDGLPDAFEQIIIDYDVNDAFVTVWDVLPEDDFDSDTYSNRQEWEAGTDPAFTDSDNDGLLDSFEFLIINFAPSDGYESLADVQPGDYFDADGLTNAQEQQIGSDPTLANTNAGSDEGRIDDFEWAIINAFADDEVELFTDVSPYGDTDHDGLLNGAEFDAGSSLSDPFIDSDGDLINDAWELFYGLNPSDPADATSDADYDGYTAFIEYQLVTDPNVISDSVVGAVVLNHWSGIGGNNESELTQIAAYPYLPESSQLLFDIQFPSGLGDNYGNEARGYLLPDQTGDYHFWVSGDDDSGFYLSSDESPLNEVRVSRVNGYTDPLQWDKYSEQKSATVSLVAGQRYYFRVIHKQGNSADHMAVAWTKPDATFEIIPSAALASIPPNDIDLDGSRDDLEQLIIDADPDDAINSLADVLASDDFDGDTLSNAVEWAAGTNATLKDSDGDSMEDAFELSREGYNPLDPADGASDYDEDGYTATIEAQLGTDPDVFDGSITGFAFSEAWHNVSGSSIASLKSDSDYPDNPNVQEFVTILQRPQNIREDYGVRVMGYITPPSTGDYYFQVSSDDAGQFWLSTDENPDNIVLRSWVDGATSYENWTQFASQTSVTLSLEVGKYYYFELYLMQNNGADHLSLRWNKPDGSFEILQSANLATFSAYDSDRDGLPDAFEQIIIDYDVDDAFVTVWDVLPEDDFEPDGFTNYQEWLAGTDPTFMDSVVSDFSILPSSTVDYGNAVTLDASPSYGTDLTYTWDLGDGSSVISGEGPTFESITHTYAESGVYTISLTVTDDVTTDQIAKQVTISVVSAFSVTSDLPYLVGDPISFDSSASLGTNLTYLWDFGDGNTSTEAAPDHIYASETPGSQFYGVSLTVSDGYTDKMAILQIEVFVPVTADIVVAPEEPYLVDQTLSFDGSGSTGLALSYSWTFGDGGVSTEQSPTHAYETDGQYTVTLEVTDGTTTDLATFEVAVGNVPASASFAIEELAPYAVDQLLTFNPVDSQGTGNVTYTWNFGDGSPEVSTSTEQSVNHAYTVPGDYTITLTVANDETSDVTSTVINIPVQAAFSVTNSAPYLVGQVMSFDSGASVGADLTYAWDFGDSNTSTAANPTHIYTAGGSYTVSLTVNDAYSSDIVETSIQVHVPVVAVIATAETAPYYKDQELSFIGSGSVGSNLSYRWSFSGDATIYTEADPKYTFSTDGSESVSLEVTDGLTTDSLTIPLQINRIPVTSTFVVTASSTTFYVDQQLTFDAGASTGSDLTYKWDFKDGTVIPAGAAGENQTIMHTFDSFGTYAVELTVSDGVDTFSTPIDVVIERIPVTAAFSFDPLSGLRAGEQLSLDASASTGKPLTYTWDFGVPGISTDTATGKTPSYVYPTDGAYTITLTVDDGFDSKVTTAPITVEKAVGSLFTVDAPNGFNVGALIDFDAAGSTGAIDTYHWDFGDGNSTSGPPETHQAVQYSYVLDGSYTVTLTVFNAFGSESSEFTLTALTEAFDFGAGPLQWVTATQGLPVNGAAVDLWEDQTPAGAADYAQSVVAKQPLFTEHLTDSAQPTSHVLFDGVNDYLQSSPVLASDATELTLILAWRALDARDAVIWQQGDLEVRTFTDSEGLPAYGFVVDGATLAVQANYQVYESVVSVITMSKNGDATWEIALNHNELAVSTSSNSVLSIDGAVDAYLGADSGASRFFSGELRGFVAVDGVADSTEIEEITDYFELVYQLSLDRDGDGLPDDPNGDADFDGIPNFQDAAMFDASVDQIMSVEITSPSEAQVITIP